MRLRNKPWAKDFMAEHPDVLILDPEGKKNHWAEEFGNDAPIHIEVGTGKGQFVIGMALANPNINYIGIEHFDNVIVSALEKTIEAEKPANLRLMRVNGEELESIFEKSEINRVYLNFSDPWPKKNHHKRRLTYSTQLDKYHEILNDEGEIWFKTDNRFLFNDSVIYLNQHDFDLVEFDVDFRAEEKDDPITEYEQKFMDLGQPIYRGVWRKKDVK